ncbi:hypothetical protein EV696_103134 [Permianibacter aggregans]|uniref:Sel1 repeat-containing protein n=2 Tax=Permianibacter aggregans TaxID=1510150 RepID=A0A4R6UW94_9GAMM|nr:hypothetical protein EV696_103134 [Permianibacter aggregans]
MTIIRGLYSYQAYNFLLRLLASVYMYTFAKLFSLALLLAVSLLPVAEANDRGDRIGPYTYIYVSDWSKLRHRAELGDPDALFRMGNLYYAPPEGSGISQSYRKAFLAFYEASLREHATSQHNVGAMYINGDYVAHDLIEGYAWMLVAAGNGDHAGKRKVKTYGPEISEEGRKRAQERGVAIKAMIEEANSRKVYKPESFGIR